MALEEKNSCFGGEDLKFTITTSQSDLMFSSGQCLFNFIPALKSKGSKCFLVSGWHCGYRTLLRGPGITNEVAGPFSSSLVLGSLVAPASESAVHPADPAEHALGTRLGRCLWVPSPPFTSVLVGES